MNTLAVVAAVLLAQAQPAPAPKKQDLNQPMTLNGCVMRDATKASSFTLTDTGGAQYRLSGKSVAKYSGMSVQVVGVIDNRRVKVVGGLWPSPNVAGQAGAIDPGKAAVAALGGGTGTGNVDLPTLRITSVGVAQGECRR